MVTILLEKILTLLTGWLEAFTTHAGNVLAKLNLIEEDTSNLSDIKNNTAETASNTASVITPINNISGNTSSIKTNTDSIKADTTIIKNNINTISTNTGSTSAFCEDIANNTLDCSNRLVTIGSDTTQLRSNSNNITADVSDIKTALNYYIGNTIVTEDSEGSICNIDTDLEDYLQKCIVTIPADLTGFSGITLTKLGKNLLDKNNMVTGYITSTGFSSGNTNARTFYCKIKPNTTYTVSHTLTSRFIIATAINEPLNGELFTNRQTNNNAEVLTITSGASDNYLWIFCYLNGTDTKTLQEVADSLTVELGNTATAYEPYKSMTYPVTFGSTITDGAEIDLLSGVVKINTSPVTYTSITPIAVRTYKGINNIYSDIGNTALTYRETLKHYLDKQQ